MGGVDDFEQELAQTRHKELLASNNAVKGAIEKLCEVMRNMPKPDAPIVNVAKPDQPIVNVQTNNDEIKGLIQQLTDLMSKQPTPQPVAVVKPVEWEHKVKRNGNGFIDSVISKSKVSG
jgi:hypothetical protein